MFNTNMYGQSVREFTEFNLNQWLEKHGPLDIDEEPKLLNLPEINFDQAKEHYKEQCMELTKKE